MNFTQKALAGIFLGKITKWNDPELTKANPGVNLPGNDIVVVHRSDGSGTTYIWTDFLSKVSEEWKNKVGKGTSVNWPVGLGGKGNEGVSGLVKQTPNAIGYIELVYAVQNGIAFRKGAERRRANSSRRISPASLPQPPAPPRTCRRTSASRSPMLPAQQPIPISSFTWLLIPEHISDAAKRDAIKDFLKWMLTEGQKYNEGSDLRTASQSRCRQGNESDRADSIAP